MPQVQDMTEMDGIEVNHITTFWTSNFGLTTNIEKLFGRLSFENSVQ